MALSRKFLRPYSLHLYFKTSAPFGSWSQASILHPGRDIDVSPYW